jgi:4-hydroxy-4-methyl-2-oxoglutarate aldolase
MPTASDTAATLLALGAATVGESGGRPMRSRIAAAWPGARVAGPVFTARCTPGDNLAIHVAVARAPVGSVVVVDVGIERELGYWGEVLTTAAEARGLVGLVIDGGVRDVAALEGHRFPVFATGVALKGATKQLPGAVGGDVEVGDVEVGAGDWIVGDADGVTVVPGDQLDDVLGAGRVRAERETRLFTALRGGATTTELLGLDSSRIEGA